MPTNIPDQSNDGEIVNPEMEYNINKNDEEEPGDSVDAANDMRFSEEQEAIRRQSEGERLEVSADNPEIQPGQS